MGEGIVAALPREILTLNEELAELDALRESVETTIGPDAMTGGCCESFTSLGFPP